PAQPSPAQPSPAQPNPTQLTPPTQLYIYKLLHILFIKFHHYQGLTRIDKGCHSVIFTNIHHYSPLFNIRIF
ncbi:TPA: hypothetical protein ACW4A9_003596, partial [Salmonella enterica subsp. enterica serovar Blockley]